MATYRRVDDAWLPAGWLRLHQDQLRGQRSVSSMGSVCLYLFTGRCLASVSLSRHHYDL